MDESKNQIKYKDRTGNYLFLTWGKNFNQSLPFGVAKRPIKWFASLSIYTLVTFSWRKWNGDGTGLILFSTKTNEKQMSWWNIIESMTYIHPVLMQQKLIQHHSVKHHSNWRRIQFDEVYGQSYELMYFLHCQSVLTSNRTLTNKNHRPKFEIDW